MSDVGTVLWKELIETRRGARGHGSRNLGVMVVMLVIFAGVWPFASGTRAFGGAGAILIGLLMAMLWVMTTAPDSFAGERDRHTLETLLSSRLPDRAILLGKTLAVVIVAVLLGIVGMVVSVIAANLGNAVHGQGGVSIPWLEIGVGVVLVALWAFLFTNVSVLVALRASSAMSAQRALGLAVAVLAIVPSVLVPLLPSGWKTTLEQIADEIGGWPVWLLVGLGVVAVVAVNVALVAATLARFVRPKLVRP